MAQVHFAITTVRTVDQRGESVSLAFSRPLYDELISTSGAAQDTSIVIPGNPDGVANADTHACPYIWVVTASGGNVFVAFGGDDVGGWTPATPSPSDNKAVYLVLDGQTREFGGYPGDRGMVIDAGF